MQSIAEKSSDKIIESCLNMHRAIFLCMFLNVIKAHSPEMPTGDAVNNFQPSLAVVVGVLAVMFILTFILLFFAKCCHRESPVQNQENEERLGQSRSGYSGIDKTVIESLPFFRFSALKGSREGLECAVCLSKFQDIEILRLLPKCKHAFHISCVDQWLERHSSCPLCRHKVSSEDHASVTYSDSLRFLQSQSDLRQDSNLELFVQREGDNNQNKSSRFIRESSFKNSIQNEEELPIQESCDKNATMEEEILHKFNHKIIVADGVLLKNRWSSVSSSDLIFLNSEMINEASKEVRNELFAISTQDGSELMMIRQDIERKRNSENKLGKDRQVNTIPFARVLSNNSSKNILDPNEKRSMSEIIVHPRFTRIITRGESSSSQNNVNEERQRRLWLPIARRTVEWFANRERKFPHSQNTIQSHV
ncbi:E3 ubiquitin-protein ligase ATL42 [Heracleum sosnowskyi]|uniref:RING-type E3 ubiquitin transferase n=1 Tax=Heracleum sosnowskyi TaxID=360622 RepID=A0AAD8GV02_9APIA|nr:E3 ubiquitin-protein ligase ATL42 [Heracleum sosnowskyi]